MNNYRPRPYFVIGALFAIMLLGILTALAMNWHERVALKALITAFAQGEIFGQGVLSPPICSPERINPK